MKNLEYLAPLALLAFGAIPAYATPQIPRRIIKASGPELCVIGLVHRAMQDANVAPGATVHLHWEGHRSHTSGSLLVPYREFHKIWGTSFVMSGAELSGTIMSGGKTTPISVKVTAQILNIPDKLGNGIVASKCALLYEAGFGSTHRGTADLTIRNANNDFEILDHPHFEPGTENIGLPE